MPGPVRRLRAVTRSPSSRGRLQAVVADDAARAVGLVRVLFAPAEQQASATQVELAFTSHNRNTRDSYFAASLDFSASPLDCHYEVMVEMLTTEGRSIGAAQPMQLVVESYDELTGLLDEDVPDVCDRTLVRRAVTLLKDVLNKDW